MTRSNHTHTGATNPAVRWFEWDVERGCLRYYDREAKRNIHLGSVNFTFMTLQELGAVGGWHRSSQGSIYSNETFHPWDVLMVKSFSGNILAEGPYSDIEDQVQAVGGRPEFNSYIAFKHGDGLAIGCWRFHGAVLMAWIEFYEDNGPQAYTQRAIEITGYTERKLGSRVFRLPVMKLREVSEQATEQAWALKFEFTRHLGAYLKRPTSEQAALTAKCLNDNYPASQLSADVDTTEIVLSR